MSAIVSIRISPCDLCGTYLFCVLFMGFVLRWLGLHIGKMNHLGKGLELRSTSSRGFQKPRAAKASVIELDMPSMTLSVIGP